MNIITIDAAQIDCTDAPLLLGYAGEDSVEAVDFDFSSWAEEYGAGTITLEIMRASDTAPYTPLLTIDGTTARWTISDVDTARRGPGVAQFIYTPEDKRRKSAVFKFYVGKSIRSDDDADPWQDLLNRLEELLGEMQQQAADTRENAEAADQSAQSAATSESNAEAWAVGERGGEPVPAMDPTFENNAKYYAGLTAASETAAEEAAAAAAQSESNAAASAAGAAQSQAGAAASETAAAGSATAAAASASAAQGHDASAASSATAASGSATSARDSERNAASSASAAAQSERDAATSAASASQSAASATASKNAAAGSASSAAGSATAAQSSATSAAASATAASGSATAAAQSATEAGNASTAATTAKEAAEDAQESAEALVQSIAQSAEQIAQNTSDIGDLKSAVNNLYTEESTANLLYLNTVKQNYYISNTNGQEVFYNNWGATDFMPVIGGHDYVFIGCYSVNGTYEYIRTDYYAFYDANKEYISGGFNSRGPITIPSDAKYIRESTNLPAFTSAMYRTMFGLNSNLGTFVGQKTSADYIEPKTELVPSAFLTDTVKDIVGHKVRVETDGSGDFQTLKDAVEYSATHEDTTILVGSGTYDLIAEFGAEYFANMTTSNQRQGLQIGNGVHIIFSSGAKVTAHYTGENDAVKTCFSPFNFVQGSAGFTLENLTLEASNVRYCVHDEGGGSGTPNLYKNVYKNCSMTINNSQNTNWQKHQCIGGGLGMHGEIIIEDCMFTDLYNINYRVPAVSYHNAVNADAKSKIVVKGCWFSKDSTVRISWYGTSEEMTAAIVHDNSMTVEPYANAENSSATIENVSLFAWNNAIRNA